MQCECLRIYQLTVDNDSAYIYIYIYYTCSFISKYIIPTVVVSKVVLDCMSLIAIYNGVLLTLFH